ncbi:MAG: DEAD/DEAH box helicase family protein, partial [Leadbetterella sp.]|nr:DEAD/DEAH box helicase family protein [Leadbetterella sp.]
MENTPVFIDVVLPVPIPRFFTYRLPREIAPLVQVGARVVVEFGKSRVLTALVFRLHNEPPGNYSAKYIQELLDTEPVVTRDQLWLFQWVAEYYMCTAGEVMNVALPSGLKISSQSKIQYNPDFNHHELLDELEKSFLDVLIREDSLSYEESARLIGETDLARFIKGLVAKHAVVLYEEVSERYRPRLVKMIRLAEEYESDENVLLLIESLAKAGKQQEAVLKYLSRVPVEELPRRNAEGIEKRSLKEQGISGAAVSTLLDKGIFEQFEVRVSRFGTEKAGAGAEITLSEAQQRASDEIMAGFTEKEVVLFHGITGSGKTEVYIDIIKKALDAGTQVLFLLPEIALTTQIVRRLKRVFGDTMGVYHSRFSDNERVEVWRGVLDKKLPFVVGVRSSIFLPFSDLGLIIVDEEHEASYKQFDPAPRYHARDVAIMLAQKVRSKV